MKRIPLYKFYKQKYGQELLIDVLSLDYIKTGIRLHPVHRETFYCIIFITEGKEEVSVNEHCRIVSPGEVICSRPGEIWKWQPDPQLKGIVLIFDEQFLLSFFKDPLFLDRFAYLRADRSSPFMLLDNVLQERICHLLLLMKEEIDDRVEKDQHILRAMLYETLMLLNRAEDIKTDDVQPMNEVSVSRYVDKFTSLVASEYTQHHDVEYYADSLCITSNYLNKVVRQTLGTTAKLYIHKLLYEEAKRRLTYTSSTINEIAESLNFDSASYFIRFFRKYAGMTPLQYRENNKSPQK
ncbi:AraC family transcriptional regulator [Prevotella sp.]|uniref:AraC family transcriptional regulator n=1 Tax=Prevotella sp. TaxID=59823 RepID=UPI003AB7EF04